MKDGNNIPMADMVKFIEWIGKYHIRLAPSRTDINRKYWYSGNFYGTWDTISEMYEYYLQTIKE